MALKKIYMVANSSYGNSVAFYDRDKAETVRKMCCGKIDEVQIIDEDPSAIDVLDAVCEALELMHADDNADEGGDDDGL